MKILLRLSPVLLILLTACGPRIIHHAPPDLQVDAAPFEALGCREDEYGRLQCPAGTPLDVFGCQRLEPANPLLGGLQPAHPLAVCIYVPPGLYSSDFPTPDQYFYNAGGLMPQLVRYVIFADGQFRLLEGPPDLRAVYAPVETPEEALAFALALYPVEAKYNLQFDPRLKYEVRELEDTHVEAVEGSYLVHVFYYQLFGCGPHYTTAVTVRVTTDGQAEILERTNLYRDPDQDSWCVD